MRKKEEGVHRLSGRNILSLNSRKVMKQSAGCLWAEIKEETNQTKPEAVSWQSLLYIN